MEGLCEHGTEPSDTVKDGEFSGCVSELMKDPAMGSEITIN
jgi:hypothetical protein